MRKLWCTGAMLVVQLVSVLPASAQAGAGYEMNDSHFHLTNYAQEGTDVREFLQAPGRRGKGA